MDFCVILQRAIRRAIFWREPQGGAECVLFGFFAPECSWRAAGLVVVDPDRAGVAAGQQGNRLRRIAFSNDHFVVRDKRVGDLVEADGGDGVGCWDGAGLNQSSAGFVVVCRHFAGASSAAGTRVVISMPASSGWADSPWVNAAARVRERMRVLMFMNC